jgi:hypothetical protein
MSASRWSGSRVLDTGFPCTGRDQVRHHALLTMAAARLAASFPHGWRADLWTENGELSLPNGTGRIRAARVKPVPLVQRGRPDHEPVMTPCPVLLPPRPRPRFTLTTPVTGGRQTVDKGVLCTLLPRSPPTKGVQSEGATAMTTHRPPAEARRAHPDHRPDQHRASRPGLLRYALGVPLWDPLWCPAPSRTGKPQVTTQIRPPAALSQPSSLPLKLHGMSVVEEIIGSGGRVPSAVGRGRRSAGGRACQTTGRERS